MQPVLACAGMCDTNRMSLSSSDRIAAVIVTHKRRDLLANSLHIVASQTLAPEWVVVVDNGNEPEVKDLVESVCADSPTSPAPVYLPSQHNLGGAGGFAYGFLTALALGAGAIFCADDDGRPENTEVLATLMRVAEKHGLEEVSPVVAGIENPDQLAFPVRLPGTVEWKRKRSELEGTENGTFIPGIASLFNGALFSANAIDQLGVPDLRLFIRGDEVEYNRRLNRSGLPYGTTLEAAYLHPTGAGEFKPIFFGKMHTQYPDNETKRYFTYRNRGYLMSQPGMRKLIPQEYARFAWFFLVQRKDPKSFASWLKLHRQGRRERFTRP